MSEENFKHQSFIPHIPFKRPTTSSNQKQPQPKTNNQPSHTNLINPNNQKCAPPSFPLTQQQTNSSPSCVLIGLGAYNHEVLVRFRDLYTRIYMSMIRYEPRNSLFLPTAKTLRTSKLFSLYLNIPPRRKYHRRTEPHAPASLYIIGHNLKRHCPT